MSIELVKIRAEISVGGSFTVNTPYIQSFNVRKARGQISTFDASLKVSHEKLTGSNTGGMVTISAGGNGSMRTIFTGILKKSTISPCWDDPGYVILNISGVDVLSKLEGKKYTRRCRSSISSWVTINSVTRPGLRSGKFESELETIQPVSGETIKNQENTRSPVMPEAQDVVTSSAEETCSVDVIAYPPGYDEGDVANV